MSRTKKDRPHHIQVRDRTAHPEVPRHEHHDHESFGQPHYYEKRVLDEVEQKWVVSERVLQGHFADYCTVDDDQRSLPPGVLAPCWTYAWMGGGKKSGWERASNRERKRTLRGRSRRELRNEVKFAEAGESVGEETLRTTRRELYSWN